MLPFEIPPGTTLSTLITEVVPAAHARLVPLSAGKEPFVCAFELDGEGCWVITLNGAEMRVSKGDEKTPNARIRAKASDVGAFLDDWTGPQRFVPKIRPEGDLLMLSDARVLKRVKMLNGTIELALVDFDDGKGAPPRRVAISISVGGPAKKVDPDADVVIETSMSTYLRLLAGGLGPEEALADGDVKVSGKRLIAMQFAFAVAPLFPKRS